MNSKAKHVYQFGAFRLDAAERLLFRDERAVSLPPKVFDTLLLLVTNHGRVLEKDEMMKQLWPDTFVEEGTLAQYISLLRKALGDSAAWIENHPRRGYRFTAPVQELHDAPPELRIEERTRTRTIIEEEVVTDQRHVGKKVVLTAAVASITVVAAVFIWKGSGEKVSSEIGSVAVLPFATAPDARHDYPMDGIAEALITRLANLNNLKVVSWSRVRQFKGSSLDSAAIGRQLGVDIVLEGSVRIASGRTRLSVHAVDTNSGNTAWALDRISPSSASLLDMEAELAQAVALRFRQQLSMQEKVLLKRSLTRNAEAYELVMRAREAPFDAAEQMLNRAIQLDPDFAEAYGWLAFIQESAYHDGRRGTETLRAAISNATRALSKDPGALIAMRALAHIQHSTGRALEGLLMARRALENNPDDLDAIAGAAEAYFRAGLHDRAIPLYEKALAAEPDNPEFRRQLARIYLYVREYEKAMEAIAPLSPSQAGAFAAVLYAEAGRKDKAIEVVRGNPENPAAIPWRVGPHNGYFLGCALAIAGDSRGARQLWTSTAERMEAALARNENPYTRAFLAMTYAKLGRREEALHHMRQSLAPEPHHPIFLFFSGQTYGLLGERQESLRSIRMAVENGFLNLPMIDFVTRPMMGLAILLDDPGFRLVRTDLARRVNELRARY